MSPARASILAFTTAGVTLAAQVLVHRLVAVRLLNNFAFLIISLTMLGFGLSGVLLSTRLLPRALERRGDWLTGAAAGLALSLLAATAVFCQLDPPPGYATLGALDAEGYALMAARALLFALPFTACGVILGVLLSAPDLSARRTYAADLAGSAVGALAVVPLISIVGVERTLVLSCAVLLIVAAVLAPPASRVVRGLAVVAGLVIVGCGVAPERVFVTRYGRLTMIGILESLGPPYGIEHTQWDAVARIELSRMPPPSPVGSSYPSLFGPNPALHSRMERMLTQNNYGYTIAPRYDGTRESLAGLEETIYSAAYAVGAAPRPRAFVIGVGGGTDVLTALAFDCSEVVAAEVNGATVDILQRYDPAYFGPWVRDPRVKLSNAEGRSHLAAQEGTFDIIQLSGVDSYAGTAAAAHVFSESYLYTLDAFELYLSKLSERGVLNCARMEHSPPREMLRALVTAFVALRRMGIGRPADHVRMVRDVHKTFAALLVKRAPFTPEEDRRLAAWARPSRYLELSLAPGVVSGNPAHSSDPAIVFASLGAPPLERSFVAMYPYDIEPVTDDRPFFFCFSRWRDARPWGDGRVLAVMQESVLALCAGLLVAAVLGIGLPLKLLLGREQRPPGVWRFAAYFVALGLGFMAVEVALIQKLGLFLGHPNLALSVVLATLLLASGAGALASEAIVRAVRLPVVVAGLLIAALALVREALVHAGPSFAAASLGARIVLAVALIAPAGVLLGVFMPHGLERLKRVAPAYVPWAWGVNGVASVLGPVLAVGLSITWGMDALLVTAVPIYLLAAIALPPEGPTVRR